VPKSFAQRSSSTDTEVVVAIGVADAAVDLPQSEAVAQLDREPLSRFKRRFERFRGLVEEQDFAESLDEEDDLRLQVMLLREENARLKAARHKPADTGTLIDHVRRLGDPDEADEVLDETWIVLSECLALREGLDQACVEIQAAMSAVRERLGKLAMQTDAVTNGTSSSDAINTSLSA
jgi:hypothetical protein